METFKQLATIHDVGLRLRQLGQNARGKQKDIYERDANSLLWAHKELRHRLLVRLLIVVASGEHKPYPGQAFAVRDKVIYVLLDPDEFMVDKIGEQFVPGKLHADPWNHHLAWVHCDTYMIHDQEDVIMLHGFVIRDYLNEVGLRTATQQIGEWMMGEIECINDWVHHSTNGEESADE